MPEKQASSFGVWCYLYWIALPASKGQPSGYGYVFFWKFPELLFKTQSVFVSENWGSCVSFFFFKVLLPTFFIKQITTLSRDTSFCATFFSLFYIWQFLNFGKKFSKEILINFLLESKMKDPQYFFFLFSFRNWVENSLIKNDSHEPNAHWSSKNEVVPLN